MAFVVILLVNSAWITEDLIWPYAEYRDKYKSSQRLSRVLQEAIDTAEDLFALLADKEVCTAIISYLKKNFMKFYFTNFAFCFFGPKKMCVVK